MTESTDTTQEELVESVKQLEEEDIFKRPPARETWRFLDGERELSPSMVLVFLVFLGGVAASVWHIYTAAAGYAQFFVTRPIHVLLIVGLGLFLYDWNGETRSFESLSWRLGVDVLLYAGLAAATIYPTLEPTAFAQRYQFASYTTIDLLLGVVITAIIIEMVRRVLGYAFLVFILVFVAYTLYGTNLPQPFGHAVVGPKEFVAFEYMSIHGIWGVPIGVMAKYVMLFILFGAFLDSTKGGLLIQRFGNKVTGGSAGGPAKVAVVTSSLMGMISGSALANVTTTGSFTIPLMKRLGYQPEDAGGIEASASSGGQLTPPIMGAVAFVMASIAQVSYLTVITLAAVPALLYYVSLFVSAHVTALHDELPSLPEEHIPNWKEVLELAHMAIPMVGLVAVLALGYSVIRAALIGLVLVWVSAMARSVTRMSVRQFLSSMYAGAHTTVIASVACAAAGLVVGMVHLTGLGLRMSSAIASLASGSVLLGLVLVMIITVMLGMGMPTVPAYAITVAIGLPALLDIGMNPLASHMFIVYFAVLSCITPPVMVSSYAAASIAESDTMQTGLSAIKFALLAFVIPYIFITSPQLLLAAVPTEPLTVVFLLATAILGALFVGIGTGGYAFSRLTLPTRAVMVASGIALIYAGLVSDLIGLTLGVLIVLISRGLDVRTAVSSLR
jgi:TRAP transporter 4TM/12TM fusion protein